MTTSVTGGKPYLLLLKGLDNSRVPAGGADAQVQVKTFKGYTKTTEFTTNRSDSWSVGLELSSMYGLFAISSITAKVLAAYNGPMITTIMTNNSWTVSIEETLTLPFPMGQFRGYYQWVIDFENGYRIFLDCPYVTLSVPKQKADMEALAESCIINGFPSMTLANLQTSLTCVQDGGGSENCYLDRHNVQVREGSVMRSFKLRSDHNRINYEIQDGVLQIGNSSVVRIEKQYGYTYLHEGASSKALIYLDSHPVRVPPNTFLTGFHLESNHGNMRYQYSYASFQHDNRKLCYSPDDVLSAFTPENEGAECPIVYLDRHNVSPPEESVLLGKKITF